MRGPDPEFRWPAVLLLLALRASERPVHEERGVRWPRRLRKGPIGSAPEDGRVPSEGRAGLREEAGPDRGPDRCESYLHLEVRRRAAESSVGAWAATAPEVGNL